jgi:hypothetical protein
MAKRWAHFQNSLLHSVLMRHRTFSLSIRSLNSANDWVPFQPSSNPERFESFSLHTSITWLVRLGNWKSPSHLKINAEIKPKSLSPNLLSHCCHFVPLLNTLRPLEKTYRMCLSCPLS